MALILYQRDDCHLCDQALAVLAQARVPEFDSVFLILPDADARVLSRELLYTALTRARRRVWLWAKPEALDRALERRTWRDSGLDARLRALRPASAGRAHT